MHDHNREDPVRYAGELVTEAATTVHYAAHLLGDGDQLSRLLRRLADQLHDAGRELRRR